MKIVQFIASRGRGGSENVVASITNAISNNHIDLELLLLPKSSLVRQINPNIPVNYLHFSSRFNPLLYLELLLFFWYKKPDIIHTHGAKASEMIHLIHRLISSLHIATKHNTRKGKIFNKLAYVTAVSKNVAKSIQNENVKVIYNGLIPLNIQPQSKQNAIFTLCCVGRLDKIKGYDILIQECSKLSFDFVLNIIGDGDEKENLSKLIKELKLEDKVFLCGFREDIETIMSCSDLVVISSHSEGFSLVMVEALFYAPMLISTRVSGAIEILSNTFLIDGFHIADKINMLHAHYDDFRIEFDTLRDRTKNNFLLSRIALEYIDYYHEVLQNA